MMLESLMVIFTLVGLVLIVFGLASLEKGETGGWVVLVLGIMLGYLVFALSQDYYPPKDLKIPKTCRQAQYKQA